MNSDLPATGTAALLELLAPFVPDDFINTRWPHGPTGLNGKQLNAAWDHAYLQSLLGF